MYGELFSRIRIFFAEALFYLEDYDDGMFLAYSRTFLNRVSAFVWNFDNAHGFQGVANWVNDFQFFNGNVEFGLVVFCDFLTIIVMSILILLLFKLFKRIFNLIFRLFKV